MIKQKEFTPVRLVLTLVLVCSCAAFALAVVQEITREPIAQAKRQAQLEAIRFVLPECANDPFADQATVAMGEGEESVFYPGRDAEGKLVGAAIPAQDKGYGSAPVKFMIGLDAEGKIVRIRVLEHQETPGLGDAIGKEKFLAPLEGQDSGSIVWKVKKDKGGVDAVTAATISSRAAVRAIVSAFAVFDKAREAGFVGAAADGGAAQ